MPVAVKNSIYLMVAVAATNLAGCRLFQTDPSATEAHRATRQQMARSRQQSDVSRASYVKPAVEEDDDSSGLGQSIKSLYTKAPSAEEAKRYYREAQSTFRSAAAPENEKDATKRYTAAAVLYKQAAKRWPKSALEEDALFMVGECYYFAVDYQSANTAYELLLHKYPHTRHLDVVEAHRFSIARDWLELHERKPISFFWYNWTDRRRPKRDTFGSGIRVFNKIRTEDPTGRLADDATMAVASAFFTKGDFVKADDALADLRRTFPSSEHQFRAHFLGIQTKLATYQGPDYDGAPLDEAEYLIKQVRKQFPDKAREHKEALRKAEWDVYVRMAEREWRQARYYDRRGEYRAANMHYDVLLKKYPLSSYAKQAQGRVEQISDKPPKPPQRLSWLVNLFPEPEEVKTLLPAGDGVIRR